MIESSSEADAEMSPTKVLTALLAAGAFGGTTSTANAFQAPTPMHGGAVARGIPGPGIVRNGPATMHDGPNIPVDLKYRMLGYNEDGFEAEENGITEATFEDILVKLENQRDFDALTRGSKATLWVQREGPAWSVGDQNRIKQVRSLAEAIQAQEEAEATGTYLFLKHPVDPMSKEDLKEWGDTAAEHEAYRVKYHHHVPGDHVPYFAP